MKLRVLLVQFMLTTVLSAQQPMQPQDPSPINGETYYLVNQLSGFQADIDSGSSADGAALIQSQRNLTSLTQRWAVTQMPTGNWKISSISNGLCVDTALVNGINTIVQQPCAVNTLSQEWIFTYTANGYNTVTNAGSGLNLDVSSGSTTAGAQLVENAQGSSASQSQLWLLRPAFFRGDDNGQLGKQEALRTLTSTPFFNDAGTVDDVLQIMKNHGVNLIRVRPTPLVVPGTTTPLYGTYTLGSSSSTIPLTCTGNGCYANTDAAELAVAKRAKELGMSVELTLFYDGGSSQNAPDAWAGYSISQTSSAIYTYVKAQLEEYRAAGAMPDIVAIGNEVDTGFLSSGLGSGASGSPGTTFTNFATYENQGMQAVLDAAADPSLGAPIPAPLRCIHITPAWPINTFFASVNANNIPYDLVCQSYYPPYHGALTAAQAASCSTPPEKGGETEDQELADAASQIGKPILLLEIGEHYENGFLANDCFYPATRAGQRQAVLDIESAVKALPGNLAAGLEWWDATGTIVPLSNGSYANTYQPNFVDQLYTWDGFNLFDDGDGGSYITNTALPTYDSALPALAAVGGKLDATLPYKLVNLATGRVLEVASGSSGPGAALDTGVDSGVTSPQQQWIISSNGDGYFQIANLVSTSGAANVLDNGSSTTSGSLVNQQAADSSPGQEWDVVGAGNQTFTIANKASGMVLSVDTSSSVNGSIEQQTASASNIDWITPMATSQQWKIVPAHILAAGSLGVAATPVFSPAGGSFTSAQTVTISDSTAGATIYFTTDGTAPTASSTAYSSGFTVSSSETLRAIAAAAGYSNSAVASASFTITPPPADFSVALSPAALTIAGGQSGTTTVSISPENGFNATISFSCSGLPSGATCTFSPANVTPSGASTTTSLSISAPQSAHAVKPSEFRRVPRMTLAVAFLCFLWLKRRRVQGLCVFTIAMIGLGLMGGCGGGSSQQQQQSTTSTVTVNATAGSLQHSATLTLTVQ
jgi:arabinogalactan endo-1,4-beta-galactosidase